MAHSHMVHSLSLLGGSCLPESKPSFGGEPPLSPRRRWEKPCAQFISCPVLYSQEAGGRTGLGEGVLTSISGSIQPRDKQLRMWWAPAHEAPKACPADGTLNSGL